MNSLLLKIYFTCMGHMIRVWPRLVSIFPPRTLIVEASNICMLKCPACATVNFMNRRKGVMSFDTFKKLLDGVDWKVKRINYSYAGEPLCNNDLFRMIAYAKEMGIDSIVETNGVLLGEHIGGLLDSGLAKLNIACDGTDRESLSKYRKGMDFNALVDSVRRLTREKAKRGLDRPEIHLQFIVMKHNEDRIDEAISMAGDLGVDYIDIKSMILSGGSGLTKAEKDQLAVEFLPIKEEYKRYERVNGEWRMKRARGGFCTHVLSDTVVMWNGDVTICTMDVQGDLVVGNILKEPLRAIWTGEKYKALRKKVLSRELKVCKECAYLVGDFRTISTKR